MVQPLVSVIIPLYNAEKHIAETISSVLAQTWPNIELVIVDDGSTDNSLSLARLFESDTVKVIHQKNSGASTARNTGLKEARGDYIQFLDADDLLSPDKIEAQVKVLVNSPKKLAVCSTVHFTGNDYSDRQPSDYEEKFLFDSEDPVKFLINLWGGYSASGSMISVHAWLTPRKIIDVAGKWNEQISMDDDGEYYSRIILASAGIVKTGGFAYYRRSDQNSSLSSQDDIKSYSSMLYSYKLKKTNLLSRTNEYAAKAAIYKMFINLAAGSYLKHPAISKLAEAELPRVNMHGYKPSVGGRLSTWLSKIIGWKAVKHFQRII